MAIIKENEIFPLGHVTLYAKGWYNKSDDVFEDLKKILILDDYTPFSNNDVLSILINNYNKYFNINLLEFLSDLHKENCWKISYCAENYDYYTAIIYKILSDLRFIEAQSFKKAIPKYSIQNPRSKNISLQKVIEVFNK